MIRYFTYKTFMAKDFAEKLGDAAGNADLEAARAEADRLLENFVEQRDGLDLKSCKSFFAAVPLKSADGFLFLLEKKGIGVHLAKQPTQTSLRELVDVDRDSFYNLTDLYPSLEVQRTEIRRHAFFTADLKPFSKNEKTSFFGVSAIDYYSLETVDLFVAREDDKYYPILQIGADAIRLIGAGEEPWLRAAADYLNHVDASWNVGGLPIDTTDTYYGTDKTASLIRLSGKYHFWLDVADYLGTAGSDGAIYDVPGIGLVRLNRKTGGNKPLITENRYFATPMLGGELGAALRMADPKGKRFGAIPLLFHITSYNMKGVHGCLDDFFPVFEDGRWKSLRDSGRIVAREQVGAYDCTVRRLDNPERGVNNGPGSFYHMVAEPCRPGEPGLSPFFAIVTDDDPCGAPLPVLDKPEEEGVDASALAFLLETAGIECRKGDYFFKHGTDDYFLADAIFKFEKRSKATTWKPMTGKPGVEEVAGVKKAFCYDAWGRIVWSLHIGNGFKAKPEILARKSRPAFRQLTDYLAQHGRGLHPSYQGVAGSNGYKLDKEGYFESIQPSALDDVVFTVSGEFFTITRDPNIGLPTPRNQFSWQVWANPENLHMGSPGALALADDGTLIVRVTPSTLVEHSTKSDKLVAKDPKNLRFLTWVGRTGNSSDTDEKALIAMRAAVLEAVRLLGCEIKQNDLKRLDITEEDLPEPANRPSGDDVVVVNDTTDMSWVRDKGFWVLNDGLDPIARFDPATGILNEVVADHLDDLQAALPVLRARLAA